MVGDNTGKDIYMHDQTASKLTHSHNIPWHHIYIYIYIYIIYIYILYIYIMVYI